MALIRSGASPSPQGLSGLSLFNVSHNQLTGAIPDLSGLTAWNLDFSCNQLSGTVPAASYAQFYKISNNNLGGSLPAFASMHNLLTFHASHNQLNGNLPDLSGSPQRSLLDLDRLPAPAREEPQREQAD